MFFEFLKMDILDTLSFWTNQYQYERDTEASTEEALVDVAFEDLLDGLNDW